MRILKFLVVFMGLLIIIGTSFLIYLIIFKSKDDKTLENHYPIESKLDIPHGAKILDMSSSNKYITLKIVNKTSKKIIVIDIFSGKIIKKIDINELERNN